MKKITARISFLFLLLTILPIIIVLWTVVPNILGKPVPKNPMNYNFYFQEELNAQQFTLGGDIFLTVLCLMALFYVTYIWASTKIVLDNDKLKTYIPRYFFLIHSSYINTAEISQIVVQTTTPLIPDKTSISQINWRDKIHIVSSNQKFVVIVPLFIFPKAKAVILELIAQNPTISIVFTKNTIMENINKSIK